MQFALYLVRKLKWKKYSQITRTQVCRRFYGSTLLPRGSDSADPCLDAVASAQAADQSGRTALALAKAQGRQDLVDLLLEHGAQDEPAENALAAPGG